MRDGASNPVPTMADLCDADGKQGAQNLPETDGTSRGAIGGRRLPEDIGVEKYLIQSLA